MEPVVYDFAINERGTLRRPAATATPRCMPPGYYTLIVPALLRHGPRAALAAAPRRAGHASAPPAARSPELRRHGADAVRPPAAARQGRAAARRQSLGDAAGAARLRPRAARADPRRPAQRAASAWRRTACPPAARIEDVRPDDVLDAHGELPDALSRARHGGAAPTARWPWSRWPPAPAAAGRKGAGVVKALQPVLQAGRPPPHASSRCTWPRAAASSRLCGAAVPHVITTSYLTHDADRAASWRAERNYGYPGPLLPLARPQRSACAWSPWCATCASPGRRCRSRCSTSRQQKVRDSLHASADRLGAQRRRGQRLHRQPARCSACTRSATGTRCRTCCATACWRACWPSARSLQYLMLHNIDTLGADVDPGAARAAHRRRARR